MLFNEFCTDWCSSTYYKGPAGVAGVGAILHSLLHLSRFEDFSKKRTFSNSAFVFEQNTDWSRNLYYELCYEVCKKFASRAIRAGYAQGRPVAIAP
jgi:hypothetical protein